MAEEKFLDDIGDTAPASPEPAAKPEPKPAAEPPVKAEAEPAERQDPANSPSRPEGYVPRQALEEARREAKEHRDRAAILEDRTNKILERYFSQNQPAQDQQHADAPPHPGEEPDAQDDPMGWITWRQQADRFVAHQQGQQRAQHTEVQRVIETKQNEYAAVREQFPAIEDARQVVLKGWAREFMLQGFRGAALTQKVEKAEADYVVWAHRQNIPIGNVIAELAMSRGWQPPTDDAGAADKTAVPAADAGSEIKRDPSTGQFLPAEQEKAARIKTSQERNGSLNGVPGAAVEKMTAKELASLSEDEMWRRFDSVKNSRGKKDFDRRMNFN